MAKEKVKHLSGVFASVFAHAGHITKEDAKEISGLDDHSFEHAYDKAANIAENVAVKRKLPVAFFSLEMSEVELAQRFIACRARISALSIGPKSRPLAPTKKTNNTARIG